MTHWHLELFPVNMSANGNEVSREDEVWLAMPSYWQPGTVFICFHVSIRSHCEENNPIVFARAVPTVTTLRNAGSCPFPFFKKLHCCSQWMLKFCYHDSTVVYQLLLAFRGERLQARNGILLFALLVTRAVVYPRVLACADLCPYALYTLSRRSSFLTAFGFFCRGLLRGGTYAPACSKHQIDLCWNVRKMSHYSSVWVCTCENDGRTASSGDPVRFGDLSRDGLKTDAGRVCAIGSCVEQKPQSLTEG